MTSKSTKKWFSNLLKKSGSFLEKLSKNAYKFGVNASQKIDAGIQDAANFTASVSGSIEAGISFLSVHMKDFHFNIINLSGAHIGRTVNQAQGSSSSGNSKQNNPSGKSSSSSYQKLLEMMENNPEAADSAQKRLQSIRNSKYDRSHVTSQFSQSSSNSNEMNRVDALKDNMLPNAKGQSLVMKKQAQKADNNHAFTASEKEESEQISNKGKSESYDASYDSKEQDIRSKSIDNDHKSLENKSFSMALDSKAANDADVSKHNEDIADIQNNGKTSPGQRKQYTSSDISHAFKEVTKKNADSSSASTKNSGSAVNIYKSIAANGKLVYVEGKKLSNKSSDSIHPSSGSQFGD